MPPKKKDEAAFDEEKEVNRLLVLAGYKKTEIKKMGKCSRAGLIRGYFGFKFTGDPKQLDTVVLEGDCKEFSYGDCTGVLKATVRDLLKQRDYGGDDYEDNSLLASVRCGICDQGQYVTNCCNDEPDWNCGKFHNHCTKCPGLGECLGDYREVHCPRCHDHYHRCYGGGCPCLESSRRGGSSRGGRRGGK